MITLLQSFFLCTAFLQHSVKQLNCAGIRQSMATAGALIGSSAAASIFAVTGQNYILTFAAAAIPPGIAILWLASVRMGNIPVFVVIHFPTIPAVSRFSAVWALMKYLQVP